MKKGKVLITGCSGFIGKYVCKEFVERGYEVIGIDKEPSDQEIKFFQHDLTNRFNEKIDVDYCIHLASSVGGILFNNSEKSDMISYNDSINRNTYTIVKDSNAKFIFFSSINVFESSAEFNHGPVMIPPNKTSYAKSKYLGEEYFSSVLSDLIIIRPTNVFGKGQLKTHNEIGESHVIPDLIHKIKANKEVEVLGDGSQERNFVHANLISTFLPQILKLKGRYSLNLRSEITISIKELALELSNHLDKKVDFKFNPSFMELETFKIRDFDITIPESMGWNHPIRSIEEGLTI